jgi:hypothetical protein
MNVYEQHLVSSDFYVPAGRCTLRVTVETSAFNMMWLVFVKKGTAPPAIAALADIATDDNGDPAVGKRTPSSVPFSLSEAVVAASDIVGLQYDSQQDAWAASSTNSAVLSMNVVKAASYQVRCTQCYSDALLHVLCMSA